MGHPQQNGDSIELPYSLHAFPFDLWRGMQDGFVVALWKPTMKDREDSMAPGACLEVSCTETVNHTSS